MKAIFHLSFDISHWSFGLAIAHLSQKRIVLTGSHETDQGQWLMTNEKCQMTDGK